MVKEPLFLMMVASVTSMSVGVPHVLFFIPTYVRSLSLQVGDPQTLDPALLLSATSIADLVGRIAFGVLLDQNLAPKHIIYALMILICGFSVIGLALFPNPTGLTINMLLYGLGSGAWFLMVPLLLADYLGVERIGASYGLIRLFQAVSNLVGPIVGGVLSDQTGSFAASFIVMGTMMNLGAISVFFQPWLARKNSSNSGCVE